MKTLLLSKQLLSLVLISFVHIFAQGHFSGGSGTESDPFVITSPQQLSNIRYYTGPEHKQKHFLLQNNIDLGTAPWNQGSGWEPIGSKDTLNPPFEGAFDGNGKSISNFTFPVIPVLSVCLAIQQEK